MAKLTNTTNSYISVNDLRPAITLPPLGEASINDADLSKSPQVASLIAAGMVSVASDAVGSLPAGLDVISRAELTEALALKRVVQNFTNETSVTVTHNFNDNGYIIQVFDELDLKFEPDIVTAALNTLTISFFPAKSGRVVVVRG